MHAHLSYGRVTLNLTGTCRAFFTHFVCFQPFNSLYGYKASLALKGGGPPQVVEGFIR